MTQAAQLLADLADRAALIVWALMGIALVVALTCAYAVRRKLYRDSW